MADHMQHPARMSVAHSRSIGITQRVTPLAVAWTGEQRVRFTDFQVNEIGTDGKVVHLCCIGRAKGSAEVSEGKSQDVKAGNVAEPVHEGNATGATEIKSETAVLEKPSQGATEAQEAAQSSKPDPEKQRKDIAAEDAAILTELVGEKFVQGLLHLYRGESVTDGQKPAPLMTEPMDDKSKRTRIHGEVRRIFNSEIETSTDASGAVIAARAQRGRGRRRAGRGREPNEEKPTGEYLHFTLYKDNRDTMEAVNQIARGLHIKPQSAGYAGTKDRRASTAQRCSLRHVRQRALAGCSSKLWGIETGDYEYHQEPIHLGQLLGNEFVIILKNCRMIGESRDLTPAERLATLQSQVSAAMDNISSRGWINYFGHQRFGTYQVGTHEIGKLLLGGLWEEAVAALLSYDEETAARAAAGEEAADAVQRDLFARHHACMLFKKQSDPARAAKMMPAKFAAESCILRHLTRPGTGSTRDFSGALTHITRGLRSMYLHAYQSYVWNHAASRRWELYGDRVVAGDLVLVVESETTSAQAPLVAGQDDDGDDIVNPTTDDGDAPSVRARPLTAEEAASGRWSIFDVVLPSPGYDVVYPTNELGAFYTSFMGRPENGSMDPHSMRRLHREFSLPGRYRKLMGRFLGGGGGGAPEVRFRLYADDTEQMHPTDLDRLRASSSSGVRRKRDTGEEQGANKRLRVDGHADAGDAKAPPAPKDEEKAAAQVDVQVGNTKSAATAPPEQIYKIAAVVKFQLASSAYATVVLRELMGDLPDADDNNDKDNDADVQGQDKMEVPS